MTDDRGLIRYASLDLGIEQSHNESELAWKRRVVYSIIGVSATAALLDVIEGGIEEEDGRVTVPNEVSVVHVKRRIRELWDAYLAVYPEIANDQDLNASQFTSEQAAEEIFNLLIDSGCAHTSPYRVYPCVHTEANCGQITLTRGQPLLYEVHADVQYQIKHSGIGAYYNTPPTNADARNNPKINRVAAREMFQLSRFSLREYWQDLVKRFSESETFDSLSNPDQYEYLNVEPTGWKRGYFVDYDQLRRRDGEFCLARTRLLGPQQLYYLCQSRENALVARQLPEWQTRDGAYRQIANSLLASQNFLPPILYRRQERLVHIWLQYLLPPRELNWFRLYSWPESFKMNKYGMSTFKRIMTEDVFDVFQKVLTELGYSFQEEK